MKLYQNSTIDTNIAQDDPRVAAQFDKLSNQHLSELEKMKGKTVEGEILFFPENGYYAYTKCSKCRMTAPLKEASEDICDIEGCGGTLKNCYKVDIKFTTKTEDVIHLTGFDEVFSHFERKSNQKSGQSLETRFKRLMNRHLTIFYKTGLKRNAAGESVNYIDSIKLMD